MQNFLLTIAPHNATALADSIISGAGGRRQVYADAGLFTAAFVAIADACNADGYAVRQPLTAFTSWSPLTATFMGNFGHLATEYQTVDSLVCRGF